MVVAYLDTCSGIAGDMTLAALVDAGADREYVLGQLRSLGLPNVELKFSETYRHCFRALMLDVIYPEEHAHRHLSDIQKIIEESSLTPRERSISLRLFERLGQAEAKVHGTSLEAVHFHEVGAVDSIVDIIGTAVAISNLNITRVVASPTPTGYGTIQIAHGPVSIPAPATAELLKGIPIQSSRVEAELTTPTGAAILATLADQFGPLPSMQISRIGYGAGHKELKEQANLLRVLIGEPICEEADEVDVIETNLDDATGEQLGFAISQLWKSGVLDVYTTAVAMKKNRPGTLVTVVCLPGQRSIVEDCLFQHTGSLGVRRSRMARRKLHREIVRVDTPYGRARVKLVWTKATNGAAELRFSPEYEDCRQFAEANSVSLEAVFQSVLSAARGNAEHFERPSKLAELDFGDSVDRTETANEDVEHSHGGHASDHSHDHHNGHHH